MSHGPLFIKWTDVLPQYLVKSRSREIWVWTIPIALKFDKHLSSSAAEMHIKFQSDSIIITSNLAASRLPEICGKTVCHLVNRGPGLRADEDKVGWYFISSPTAMNWEHVLKLSSEMFQLSRSYEGQVHDYVVLIILQSQSTTSTNTIFEVTPSQGKLDAHITHACV